ncbi:MAG TPA: DUF4974 domain-containing protein [Chitinophagaceae bacterium]
MANDQHITTNPLNHGHYPEPDIPAGEAWAQMKQMLATPPAPRINTGRHIRSFLSKHAALYTIPGVAIASAITLYVALHQPSHRPATTYTTQSTAQKDSLSANVVAYLDQYSSITTTTNAQNEMYIQLHGGLYLQAIPGSGPAVHIIAGKMDVLPSQANVYVSFDSSSAVANIQVQSGKAIIKTGNESLVLTAGNAAQYDQKTLHWDEQKKLNVNAFAYATHTFEFNNAPLLQVAQNIEKAYGVTIQFANPALSGCRITTRFDNRSLKEVLDILTYTLNFDYTLDEQRRQVLFKGDGCN